MLPLDPYCQSAFGQIKGFLRIWDSDHWDSGFRTMAFGDPLVTRWWPKNLTLKPANHHHFPLLSEQPEAKVASCFCASWIVLLDLVLLDPPGFFFQAWLDTSKAPWSSGNLHLWHMRAMRLSPLISNDIPIRYPYKISIDIPFYQHFSLWNPHSVL